VESAVSIIQSTSTFNGHPTKKYEWAHKKEDDQTTHYTPYVYCKHISKVFFNSVYFLGNDNADFME
jgi:hypothetical protein